MNEGDIALAPLPQADGQIKPLRLRLLANLCRHLSSQEQPAMKK